MTRVQMLADSGEWQDLGPVRKVTFEPFERESTSERVTMSTGSEWSLSMNYVGGDASPLRELLERLEREARWRRWAGRTWLSVPLRSLRCRLGAWEIELLPWQARVMDAVLSGKRLEVDWRRRG